MVQSFSYTAKRSALRESARRGTRFLALFTALLAILSSTGRVGAEVVRFEITSREPFAEGESFGEIGAYERIIGKLYFAIDPALEHNRNIVDLDLAPCNEHGKVEFSSDLFILVPKDPCKGNGGLLYDVNNRGNKLALLFFNSAPRGNDPKTRNDAGNGYLMRYGFTVVWSGWDGELLPGDHRMQLTAPVAIGKGKPIAGRVRYEIVPKNDVTRININRDNHGSYRPTPEGLRRATLTWRLRPGDPRVPIPREQFCIHVTDAERRPPGQLPLVELEMPAALKQGYIYELIYEARDPLVHGTCFAGVRDLVSAFKHGTGQGNPLTLGEKPVIRRAYGFGVSQAGRFLREFVYCGFNEDEKGARVFDGLIPHAAGGGLGSFNHRFAQPTGYVTQHEHHECPTDRFPFAYGTQEDPASRRTDGILRQAVASKTVPLLMHTQSSAEYWSRSGSLVHTDPLGKGDAKVPDSVRIYAFGGTQHVPSAFPPQRGMGQTMANPADYRPLLRGLLLALGGWCRHAEHPPPSVYPTIRDGTLVGWDQRSSGFPFIPGIRYPEVIQEPPLLDLGPRWQRKGIIDFLPPRIAGHYTVLVPKCGADGNELGSLLPAEVAVPLATFTGWNLRSRESGAENELVSLNGSYIPLPFSRARRQATGRSPPFAGGALRDSRSLSTGARQDLPSARETAVSARRRRRAYSVPTEGACPTAVRENRGLRRIVPQACVADEGVRQFADGLLAACVQSVADISIALRG